MTKATTFLLLALSLLLLPAAAAGCVSGRMMVAGDVAETSDPIVATNRSRASGLFVNEGFDLGPYQILGVHRSWEKGGGGDLGLPGVFVKSSFRAEGFYRYEMKAAEGLYTGNCGTRISEESTRVLGVVVNGQGNASAGCNCSGAAPGVVSFTMSPASRWGGEVTGREGVTAALRPVYTWDDGKIAAPFSMPIGWEIHSNIPLGAVEVWHPGRVWTNRGLDPVTRADLACLFVGLLLYRPLSTGQ